MTTPTHPHRSLQPFSLQAFRLSGFFLALAVLAALALAPAPDARAARANNSGAVSNRINNRAQSNLNKTNQMARRNTSKNDSDEGLIANIDEDWYLEVTPGYVRAGSADMDSLWGATFALGYRLSENDKIQLEIGYYQSGNISKAISYKDAFTYDYTVAGIPQPTPGSDSMNATAVKRTGSVKVIPVLLSYSYILRLDAPGRYEVRFTPAIGVLDVSNSSWSIDNITGSYTANKGATITDVQSADGSFSAANIFPDADGNPGRIVAKNNARISGPGSSTNIPLAMGIGMGFTWNFAPRVYVDAGYRYLWTTKVGNRSNDGPGWNGTTAWNGSNLSFFTLTLGWKF